MSWILGLGYALSLLIAITFAADDPLVVETTGGKVAGFMSDSRSGRQYLSFTGIPFAKPPVGELRFQPPQEPEPWSGIRKPTDPDPFCVQINLYQPEPEVIGEEDCLYLDVFTHDTSGSAPVIFHIHGGGYLAGDKSNEGPQYMMDEDVVVVNINYRVGIMGFLSFEDKVMSGNQGLKDQNMALRWVVNNIDKFGGDPKRITLIGESAGSGGVSHHTISAMSKGLFQGAVGGSQSVYNHLSLLPPGMPKRRVTKLAKMVSCPFEDTQEAVSCLQGKDAKELVGHLLEFRKWQVDPLLLFQPALEPSYPGAFVTGPISSWESSPVPMLTGTNSAEGLLRASFFLYFKMDYKWFNDNFDEVAPLTFRYFASASNPGEITKKIKQFYFNDRDITENDWVNITNIYTDAWFTNGIFDAANKHTGDVYFYYFDYLGENSFGPKNRSLTFGAAHYDDSIYLWRNEAFPPLKGEDEELSKTMVKMWVDFAKNGDQPLAREAAFEWNACEISASTSVFDISHPLSEDHNHSVMSDVAFGSRQSTSSCTNTSIDEAGERTAIFHAVPTQESIASDASGHWEHEEHSPVTMKKYRNSRRSLKNSMNKGKNVSFASESQLSSTYSTSDSSSYISDSSSNQDSLLSRDVELQKINNNVSADSSIDKSNRAIHFDMPVIQEEDEEKKNTNKQPKKNAKETVPKKATRAPAKKKSKGTQVNVKIRATKAVNTNAKPRKRAGQRKEKEKTDGNKKQENVQELINNNDPIENENGENLMSVGNNYNINLADIPDANIDKLSKEKLREERVARFLQTPSTSQIVPSMDYTSLSLHELSLNSSLATTDINQDIPHSDSCSIQIEKDPTTNTKKISIVLPAKTSLSVNKNKLPTTHKKIKVKNEKVSPKTIDLTLDNTPMKIKQEKKDEKKNLDTHNKRSGQLNKKRSKLYKSPRKHRNQNWKISSTKSTDSSEDSEPCSCDCSHCQHSSASGSCNCSSDSGSCNCSSDSGSCNCSSDSESCSCSYCNGSDSCSCSDCCIESPRDNRRYRERSRR